MDLYEASTFVRPPSEAERKHHQASRKPPCLHVLTASPFSQDTHYSQHSDFVLPIFELYINGIIQ